VPLRARGQILGVLSLGTPHPEQLDSATQALANQFAQRTAVALARAQLHLETQEAIASRDEFLSVASHELKTPLTALRLNLQGIQRIAERLQVPLAPPLPQMIRRAESQGRRLARLVDRLLDVTRMRAHRLELNLAPCDLAEVTRGAVALFAAEATQAGCPIELQAPAPVVGRWDPERLEQVVINLISNACKYGKGKPVKVAVEAVAQKGRLTVTDQGIGISPENQQQLFQRFDRRVSARQYGGLGLGLYIVRAIVEALGGQVRLDSRVGAGSTFIVELPLTGPGPPGGPT
jgi:signal transduction histidine kinase